MTTRTHGMAAARRERRRGPMRKIRGRALALTLAGGFAPSASAQPAPDPDLEPEAVVRIQLEALQHNDDPEADAGIALAWAFAHPGNRAATGPLGRFAAMLRSPAYRGLIDHRRHQVLPARRSPDRAAYVVRVRSADGRRLTFGWVLEKLEAPDCGGCWLTIAVSPAQAEPPPI